MGASDDGQQVMLAVLVELYNFYEHHLIIRAGKDGRLQDLFRVFFVPAIHKFIRFKNTLRSF
mgnify:CR=1 FL=1